MNTRHHVGNKRLAAKQAGTPVRYLLGVLACIAGSPILQPAWARTAPASSRQESPDPAATPAQGLRIQLAAPLQGGSIQVLLFNSAEGFEDFQAPVATHRIPATGQTSVTVPGIPAGEYALLLFHDENDNAQLDRNFIGIPSEPIGFSNAYRPRGAPTFQPARFQYSPDADQPVFMQVARPLGERGRIGAGIGILTRSSPYRQSNNNPYTVIPALVYIGNRVQITGPYAQAGMLGRGNTRLAATLSYRQAVYEASDSSFLTGMQDREDTAMLGLSLQVDTAAGFDLEASFQYDMLGRIDAGEASLSLARPFPWGRVRITPSIGLHWLQQDLAMHDYGVSSSEQTPERPAYRPDDAWNPEAGLGLFAEITPEITGAVFGSIEWLDSEIRNSPIVADSYVLQGTAFVVYMF